MSATLMSNEIKPFAHTCDSCKKEFMVSNLLKGYWRTINGKSRQWVGCCTWCDAEAVVDAPDGGVEMAAFTGDARIPNFSTKRDLWIGTSQNVIDYHKAKAEQDRLAEDQAVAELGPDWKKIKEYAHQYQETPLNMKAFMGVAEAQGISVYDYMRKLRGRDG